MNKYRSVHISDDKTKSENKILKKSSIVSSSRSLVVTYLYPAKETSDVLFHWFGEIFLIHAREKRLCPIYIVLVTGDHSHLQYLSKVNFT